VLVATAGGGVAGAGMLALADDVKQRYEAVERTGRVAAALAICINEYACHWIGTTIGPSR